MTGHQERNRTAFFNLDGASWEIIGDYDKAMARLHIARAQLFQLDLVNVDNINHTAINKTLDDGTYVECSQADGNKTVVIIVPDEEFPGGEPESKIIEKEYTVDEDILIPLVKLYDGIYGTVVGWAVFWDGTLDVEKVLFLPWDFDTEPDPLLLTTVDIGVDLKKLAQLVGDRRNGTSDGATCDNMLQGSDTTTGSVSALYDWDYEDVIKDPWDYPPMPYMESGEEFILMRDFDVAHGDRTDCDSGWAPAPSNAWVSSFDWQRCGDQNHTNRQNISELYQADLPTILEKYRTYYTGLHMLYDSTAYYTSYTLSGGATPGSQRLTDPSWQYYAPDHRFDWDTMGTSYWKEGYSNDTNKEMSLVMAFYDTSVKSQEYDEPEFHMSVGGTPAADGARDGSFSCLLYDMSQVKNVRVVTKTRYDWHCDRAPMYWGYTGTIVDTSQGIVPCSEYTVDTWPEVSYQYSFKLTVSCKLGNDVQTFDTDFALQETEKDTNYLLGWEGIRFVISYANHLFRLGVDAEYDDYVDFVPREKLATIGDVALYMYKNRCTGDADGADYGALFFFDEERGIIEGTNPSVMTYAIEEEERFGVFPSWTQNFPHIMIDDTKYHFLQTADQRLEYYPEDVNDYCNQYGTTQRFVARFKQKYSRTTEETIEG